MPFIYVMHISFRYNSQTFHFQTIAWFIKICSSHCLAVVRIITASLTCLIFQKSFYLDFIIELVEFANELHTISNAEIQSSKLFDDKHPHRFTTYSIRLNTSILAYNFLPWNSHRICMTHTSLSIDQLWKMTLIKKKNLQTLNTAVRDNDFPSRDWSAETIFIAWPGTPATITKPGDSIDNLPTTDPPLGAAYFYVQHTLQLAMNVQKPCSANPFGAWLSMVSEVEDFAFNRLCLSIVYPWTWIIHFLVWLELSCLVVTVMVCD